MSTQVDLQDIQVVKLGGSLLDMQNLHDQLAMFKARLSCRRSVLLVGGGDAADCVRRFDQQFHLTQEQGHWLAVRAMELNAHLVRTILPEFRLVENAQACASAWKEGRWPIVKPLAWLEEEHRRGVTIPHRWSFTSDSIAAHLAQVLGANRLTLLKSALPDSPCDAATASRLGIVDGDFLQACADLRQVELVNLRCSPPVTLRLQ